MIGSIRKMEKIQKAKSICLILLIIMFGIILFCNQNDKFAYAHNSVSEIVIERDSGRVLFENNADIKRAMASTTKIVTAITVIENCDLDEKVNVKKDYVGIEGSSIYLREGDCYSVRELLYGLMLRSGNDAAMTLAIHTGGSMDKFAEMMNNLAVKAGASNSSFCNPHGLPCYGHFTTARDLAKITAYAMKNDEFKKIVSAKKYDYTSSEGEKKTFINKNKMLFNFDGADGVKTGFTKEAGRCLVSSATKNGMQLICVVLNCGPMFERSSELLDNCFSEFEMTCFLKANEPIGKIRINSCFVKDFEVEYSIHVDILYPLKNNEKEKIEITKNLPELVDFPICDNEIIGDLKVYLNNNLIYSTNVYIISGKTQLSFFEAISGLSENWSV